MQAITAVQKYRTQGTDASAIAAGLALHEARPEYDRGEWGEFLGLLELGADQARYLIQKALAATGQAPVDLPEPVAAYYADLCELDGAGYSQKGKLLRDLIERNKERRRQGDWPPGWKKPGTSRNTIYNHLRAVGSPAKLARKRRADTGQPRAMSPALADMWRILRIAPTTRKTQWPQHYIIRWDGNGDVRAINTETGEMLDPLDLTGRYFHMQRSSALRMFRKHCPDAAGVSDAAFRRVDEVIPEPLKRTHSERQYLYTRQEVGWIPPHVGFWAYDMTVADCVVWDRDPQQAPYRPYIVGIVDQLSHMPMAVLATREAPSKHTLKSALFMACRPKSDLWQACGMFYGLHGDLGEVQRSRWMKQLAAQVKRELGREIAITHNPGAYRSWSNGSAETFFKDLHHDGDRAYVADRWPVSYMGHCTTRKPVHLLRKEKPCWVNMRDRDNWYSLPTLEEYQATLVAWVEDYILRTPRAELARRIGFSRADFYRVQTNQNPELRAVPDESVLRACLTEKVEGGCAVNSRGEIQFRNARYQDANLIGYAGLRVEVRYDFHDMGQIWCYDPRTAVQICEARRSDFGAHESERELRDRVAANRQALAEYDAALELAAQSMQSVPPDADAERAARERAELAAAAGRRPTGVRALPVPPPVLEPVEPDYEEIIRPDGSIVRVAVNQ